MKWYEKRIRDRIFRGTPLPDAYNPYNDADVVGIFTTIPANCASFAQLGCTVVFEVTHDEKDG